MSLFSLRTIFFGILATLTMDILSGGAFKLRLIAPLRPGLIGRWFISIARGQLRHHDIREVAPIRREVAIAVPMHYAIGVTLALVYLVVISILGLAAHNPVIALGFALITNLLPWLLMFPAMGYGWFGTHGPPGTRLFLSSLVTHCFYGVGLWVAALVLIRSSG